MVVSFFGHSDYSVDENHIQIVLSALKKPLENGKIDFYLGGYGNFDRFALSFCNKCKKSGYSVKRYFITPYIGSFIEDRKKLFLITTA